MFKVVKISAAVVVGCLALAALYAQFEPLLRSPVSSPLRAQLDVLAATLADANRRGDPLLARQGVDAATAILRALNDQPNSARACVLAASHLGEGFVEVMQGGRWFNQDRLKANLEQCA